MSPDPPTAPGRGGGEGLHQVQSHHHPHDHQVPFDPPTDSHDRSTIAVVNADPDSNSKMSNSSSKPTIGLHSPPDSNDVDGSSDSELSDLDEAIANADGIDTKLNSPSAPSADAQRPDLPAASATVDNDPKPVLPEQAPTPEEDEGIGEVVPDHWSGNVPVFKPTMDQFKDFKKFVRCAMRTTPPTPVPFVY